VSPAAPIESGEAEAALAALPQEQREIVVLRIWADLGFAQIAELTDAPLSSVYDRYRAALSAMRKLLEPESCDTHTSHSTTKPTNLKCG
jgi:DNA-directed RNA polymerase specialized sigma24 family protein